MGLAPALDAALRGEGASENVLNTIYALVRAYEAGDWIEVERLAALVGAPPKLVGAAYCEALPWAEEAAQG